MKKLLSILLAGSLALSLAACSSGAGESSSSEAPASSEAAPSEETGSEALTAIRVGASPTPHAEILREADKELQKQGYKLDIVEFTDYVQPNLALDSGDLDANFFQHGPYLDNFNTENNTKLVSVGTVHYEPLGVYAGKTKSLEELPDGAAIAVPNDTTNEARALLLLQDQGLLTLREGAGITATKADIESNPKNLKITEIAAEQLARSLQDVDLAVINGNYAILGGLKVADALAQEEKDSLAAETYANVLAVREGDGGREDIKALFEALKSEPVKAFIAEKYEGSVVAVD
ncbi:MAG: ABC transporter substrate-binding protein [Clostridiales bacterium]|uniref:MetQ/NlpA family ABC transporter substrate-binding protein n=1 Tax=Provencibacterium massiliense TaxID=1841868 RepID=UPI0009A7B502|nr:MetQ/NlpA family ABC transporter substrate-binding protein [Provencibacterium massiliense]PWM36087.1 MAG: ABC transporter substrate-binding protein [Clostridiales bacterium]RGB63132.1 ABC transporter substrate-binding protein [Harryflintia acetispora]